MSQRERWRGGGFGEQGFISSRLPPVLSRSPDSEDTWAARGKRPGFLGPSPLRIGWNNRPCCSGRESDEVANGIPQRETKDEEIV